DQAKVIDRISLTRLVAQLTEQLDGLRQGGYRVWVIPGQLLQQAKLIKHAGLAAPVPGRPRLPPPPPLLRPRLLPSSPAHPVPLRRQQRGTGDAAAPPVSACPPPACKGGRSASSQPAASCDVVSCGALAGGSVGGSPPPAVVQVAMCRHAPAAT